MRHTCPEGSSDANRIQAGNIYFSAPSCTVQKE